MGESLFEKAKKAADEVAINAARVLDGERGADIERQALSLRDQGHLIKAEQVANEIYEDLFHKGKYAVDKISVATAKALGGQAAAEHEKQVLALRNQGHFDAAMQASVPVATDIIHNVTGNDAPLTTPQTQTPATGKTR